MSPRNSLSIRTFDLSPLEKAMVAAATALFLTTTALYITDFSVRDLLYGEGVATQKKIGVVAQATGILKRELYGEAEFRPIATAAPLFNSDTLITGSGSKASLKLEDESVIELGPDTMIKLSFGSEFMLGGISRPTTIEVISGKVTSVSTKKDIVVKSGDKTMVVEKNTRREVVAELPKTLIAPRVPIRVAERPQETPVPAVPEPVAPTAPPAPVLQDAQVRLVEPQLGARVPVRARAGVPSAPVTFRWNVNPAPAQLELVLTREGQEVHRQTIDTAGQTEGKVSLAMNRPGAYGWTIKSVDGERALKPFESEAGFTVAPVFEGIQGVDALIAGEKRRDNRYSGKKPGDFSISLRWKELEGAKTYNVWVADSPNAQSPLISKQVEDNQLVLSAAEAKRLQGVPNVYYRVSAPMKNGFIAQSPTQELGFNFVPPQPMSPATGSEISLSSITKDKGRILFTWQKTNFTDAYEIELAKDPSFQALFVKRKIKDNFIILKFANPGVFYWRVRSYLKDQGGPVSQSTQLTISP